MALSEEDIFSKVQESLVDALGVDDDEVTDEATLVGDLALSRSTSWTSCSNWKKLSVSPSLAKSFRRKTF